MINNAKICKKKVLKHIFSCNVKKISFLYFLLLVTYKVFKWGEIVVFDRYKQQITDFFENKLQHKEKKRRKKKTSNVFFLCYKLSIKYLVMVHFVGFFFFFQVLLYMLFRIENIVKKEKITMSAYFLCRKYILIMISF